MALMFPEVCTPTHTPSGQGCSPALPWKPIYMAPSMSLWAARTHHTSLLASLPAGWPGHPGAVLTLPQRPPHWAQCVPC